jgi:2,4-dienoyl-CoA reductase-like NADH-dependent reductase (Old Yellow Enzyme family)
MTNLFTPITVGDYTLPNRIFMAPLKRARSDVAKAIHDAKGKIFIQLWHMGTAVSTDFIDGKHAISSSNVALEELRTPKNRKQKLEAPTSKTDMKSIQNTYNEWMSETGYSLTKISRILSLTIDA